MNNKIFIFLFILFSFFSCSLTKEDEKLIDTKSLLQKFEQTDFEIEVPKAWEVLKSDNKIFPKPAYGEIIFDAKSKELNDNFYRNILVLKQKLEDKNIRSTDFIGSNYIGAKKNYFYIKDIEKENVIIDGKKTKLYIFDAKYSEDTPIVKFLQTGIVCKNNYAYLITLALEKNNKNIDRYKKILGSFKCKISSK